MAFAQEAETIAQQFQLSAANVDQVTNIAAEVATEISNETVQNCITEISESQGIVIDCSPTGFGACDVNVEEVTFSQGTEVINNCILRQSNAQRVINDVTQEISQKGTAKVESLFGPIIAIVIVIVLIVGAVFLRGTKALTDWRLWVVVIVAILIYLGIAYWRKWFPFEQKTKTSE